MTVAVVGGGITGAACAAALRRRGIGVRLMDRGQRLGGRMAVRTLRETGTGLDGRVVDIGASYLTTRNAEFTAVVEDWVARGLARPWTDTFHVADPDGIIATRTGPMRYAAPAGLRSLVEDLIAGSLAPQDVHHPHDVQTVDRCDGGARVDGELMDAVALCMPGPQVVDLLDRHDEELEKMRLMCGAITWEPVLSMTAIFSGRCWPELDGVFVNDDPVLTWIADDGQRRGDGAPVLVAHADPVLSALHAPDPMTAAPAMVAALRRILQLGEQPEWVEVKRWGLARPSMAHAEPFLSVDGIGVAGDTWAAGPRIESAWLSGHSLGNALVR